MKRFQFTIRDLLLIIVIAALAAGWWIDHQRINRLAVQQWEYRETTGTGGVDALVAELGDEGWEVCNVHYAESGTPGGGATTVLLKRPKK